MDGKNHWLANPHKGLFRLDDIITQNPEMLTLKDTVQRVAANTSPVLIWGETGTGKELFAQSLHSHSSRARGPFVAQNCAAIPTTLLESTLFGTTRGSYTGAENRKGLLKQADGGTLFLDEVNSMDLSLQAKILKAIEEKRFRPVGGEQDVHSDVRIVSAMNVDPITAVREGLLRRDLFYRLGVVQLALPPLRKRPEDIPLLTDFYVEQYNRNMGRAISGVSELVRNALLAYDWPGNVRELQHTMERVVILGDGSLLKPENFQFHVPPKQKKEEELRQKKRQEEIAKKYPSVSYKIAEEIEAKTGMEIRVTVPGHMQRGGSPCPYDRVLSTRLGSEAAQLILDKQYGYMVGMVNGKVKKIPLGECAGKLKTVDPNAQEVLQAKRMGISFGD